VLEHYADILARLGDIAHPVVQRDAVDDDLPLLVRFKPVEAADEGRLSGTGRAADDDALPFLHRQVDVLQPPSRRSPCRASGSFGSMRTSFCVAVRPKHCIRREWRSRRLRSAFALFKPSLSGEEPRRLNGEMRWLAGVLGDARNIDMLLAEAKDADLRFKLKDARQGRSTMRSGR